MRAVLEAFASGFVMEGLYAAGVLVLADRRKVLAALLSVVWGAAVCLGVDGIRSAHLAAIAWCFGLGFGTLAGATIAERPLTSIRVGDSLGTMGKELMTLPVLAGAYTGKRGGEMLTHLGESSGTASCGKATYLADQYAHTPAEREARPTCPRCAKRWDKLHGAQS